MTILESPWKVLFTVEPRFYEVPIKGLEKFVRYIEGSLYRTPPHNEFSGKLPIRSLCILQNPAFPDLKIATVMTFQYRAMIMIHL